MSVVEPPEQTAGSRAAARRERLSGWRVGILASPAAPVYGALIGIIILAWIVITIDGGQFLTTGNIVNMLQRSVALGIVSLGQTIVILLGSLDLSVAALISLSSLVTASQMQDGSVVMALVIVLLLGVGVGLANGLIITKLRVNAFIATLGMALILGGIIQNGWSGPQIGVDSGFSENLGYTRFGVIPMSFILFAVVAAIIWFVLNSTRFGYSVYAVGGSEDVSKLSGLRTHRTIIIGHILCSLTAVITGIFLAARLKAGTPTVGSDGGYDLESIAAVVLGGTALAGGRGGVIGTIGGVFILAVLDNVFNQLEFNSFLRDVVRGIIIIAAVAVYARRTEKKA